jgi:hypothetical protein
MFFGLETLSLSKNSLKGRIFPNLSDLNRLILSEEIGKDSEKLAGILGIFGIFGKLGILFVLLIFSIILNKLRNTRNIEKKL